MNKYNIDVCLVQDTGRATHPSEFKNNSYHIISKPSSCNDPAGVLAIIIKNTLINAISPMEEEKQPKNKRIWIINNEFPIKHKIYIVYNKNSDVSILNYLLELSPGEYDVIAGDLNSFPSQLLDQVSSSAHPAPNSHFINKLLDAGWNDSFRYINPTTKAYSRIGTYKYPNTKTEYYTATRIDHILIRSGWILQVEMSTIIEKNKCDSDHCLVILQLRTEKGVQKITKEKITIRPNIKNKLKWIEFKNTFSPLPPSTGDINQNSEEFSIKTLEHFNKIFPEKTIPINHWHKEVCSTYEYLSYKKSKKIYYHIIAHIKKVIYSNSPPNHNYLKSLINNIQAARFNIEAVYNLETITLAYKNKNYFAKKIRNMLNAEKIKYIKKNVEKIIKEMDANGHKVFQLLKTHTSNPIACIFKDNKVLTDSNEINDFLHAEWETTFTSTTKKNKLFKEFLDTFPTPSPPLLTQTSQQTILLDI